MRRLTAAVVVAAVALSGCLGDSEESSPPSGSAVCGYLYEWASAWRFPLQPDPHAAYTYVVPKVTSEPIAYLVSGPFPYAAWTSWTLYNSQLQPFSVAKDSAIAPDKGSVNPFVAGTPVLSAKRSFKLLLLPRGTDTSTVAESLRDIPASNRLATPTAGKFFIVANRVYNAFPGYNRGGAAGPTKTPFPQVKAINYRTGAGVDCSRQNLLPRPKPPTDMPATAPKSPSPAAIALTDGTRLSAGPDGSRQVQQGGKSGLKGAQFAPRLDPDRLEFTRPPLLPGADVSKIPPADSCAGYLGAATDTEKIGLIRMPHVAKWFETHDLTPGTAFSQDQTTFISFTQYGSGVSVYDPGSPDTASRGNEELAVDSTGGTTIMVWPRSLTKSQQRQAFDYAERRGWATLRGGEQGPITTANLLIRLKGASPDYAGDYSPTPDQPGVPCYFDDHPDAKRWSQVTGEKYVATHENIGAGAPQGVNCSVGQLTDGSCLSKLEAYVAETGGRYTARSS
jgi:hypothetical protein